MKRIYVLAACAALLAAAYPAGAVDLVVNGGFETGDFSGWSQSGDLTFTGVDTSTPHDGTYAAYFGPIFDLGFITQTLPTVAGSTYDVSFWLANDDALASNHFQFWWDGALLIDELNTGSYPYTNYILPGLTASTGATDMSFGLYNPPSFFHLDTVTVDGDPGAPVPEPATGLLVGGALALAAIAGGRRSRKVRGGDAPTV